MISLTRAEEQGRVDSCKHTRSITCLPASGSVYFCDDCGTYLSLCEIPYERKVVVRKWKSHILGTQNAHKLW
jgi:hypothetical protein